MAAGYTTKCVCTDLQEDASNSAEQLHTLLGLIPDDGVVGLHSQNIVLSTRFKEKRAYKQTNKQTSRRQWTGYSRRKCRRLESAEKSEVNNSFMAVVS